MTDPYVGEIRAVGFNFAPRGWALCNGQLLAIQQNTALFSLLGVYYGGDGRSTFGLPDLRGRAAMHAGAGPGLTERALGEQVGQPDVTLQLSEIPAHRHTAMAARSAAVSATPATHLPGLTADPRYSTSTNTTMAAHALAVAGGSQPHNNRQPLQVLNFVIALQGVFPPRP